MLKTLSHQICKYVNMLLPSLFVPETNNIIFTSSLFVQIYCLILSKEQTAFRFFCSF